MRDCETDVCDFNQLYERLEIPPEKPLFGLFANGRRLAVYLLNCGSRPSIREVTHSGAILQISPNNEERVPGRQLPAIDEAVNGVGNGECDRGSQVSWGGRSESCQAH